MSRKKRFKGSGAKRISGRFLAVPAAVLDSRAYVDLTFKARALLFDLGAKYHGKNNGDLSAEWSRMRHRGWKSEQTLNNAKKELLASGLIVETRKGGRPNKVTLYALTWFELDDCAGKLDLTSAGFEYGKWKLKEPLPAFERTHRLLRPS